MRVLSAIALALAALLLPALVAAQDDDALPYNWVELEERISVAPHDGTKGRLAVRGGVELLDYREVQYYDYFALTTVSARKPVVCAVLLYTSAAVYVVNPGLLLPSDHVTTLSAQLPERTSLLRLLVFDRQPSRAALASFAARPASATSQHLLGDLWLRTFGLSTRRASTLLPWEDQFEFFPRLSGAHSRWPYALARLDSGLRVRAKDCHARYSGLPSVEIGDYGAVGAWPLEVAESLRLGFNLPQRATYRRAQLVLHSDPPGVEFELRANGFLVPVLPDTSAAPLTPGVDIRSYLQDGANELELRPPVFGQGGRLLRVELWLD